MKTNAVYETLRLAAAETLGKAVDLLVKSTLDEIEKQMREAGSDVSQEAMDMLLTDAVFDALSVHVSAARSLLIGKYGYPSEELDKRSDKVDEIGLSEVSEFLAKKTAAEVAKETIEVIEAEELDRKPGAN